MIKSLQIRHVLGVVIVVVLLVLAGIVAMNFRSRVSPKSPASENDSSADLALKKFEYTESREGRPQWSIVAESAGYHQDTGETLVDDLLVTFFGDEGPADDLFLSALHGRIDVNTRELEVWGDVVVQWESGYTLLTEHLSYENDQKRATTPEPVQILSEGFNIRGTGLHLDVENRTLEVLDNVRARIDSQLIERRHN